MSENLGTFSDTAKTLSRNPLGIIALFIVLVYGMAALALGTANGLGAVERVLLVLFLVLFPPVVLMVFKELVIEHHTKLYGPGDFKDDQTFIAVLKALTAASTKPGSIRSLRATTPDQANLSTAVQAAISVARSAPQPRMVLWVDDTPQNNVNERQALSAAGFTVHTARTTEEALRLATADAYDVVISDMKRPEGDDAGFDLLEKLRAAGNQARFIIYAGTQAPALAATAQTRGAFGCTNDPAQLLRLVSAASLL